MSSPSLSPSSSSSTKGTARNGTAKAQASSGSSATKPKRIQVSRACDWCRVHRVKCDSEQPCHNCRSRGAQCSITGANEIRNLPHAFR